MTVSIRVLIPVAELPVWTARDYVEIYRGPGGWRVPGEAVVMEWRAPESRSHAG